MVKTFNISQPPDTAERLDLVVVCPEERQRNGPIAKFTYTTTVDGDTQVTQLWRDVTFKQGVGGGGGGGEAGYTAIVRSGAVTRVTHLRCNKRASFRWCGQENRHD